MKLSQTELEEAIKATGVYGCVECGKCVAICPMQDMYAHFSIHMSPRGMIRKALFAPDLLSDRNIWYCTECNACTDICPEGVSCRDLIRSLRRMALEQGLVENVKKCSSCGGAFVSLPVMNYVEHRLKERTPLVLALCPSCRRETYFRRNA